MVREAEAPARKTDLTEHGGKHDHRPVDLFAVLSALGTFFGGSADGGDIASALFGLVLPLVCVLLAYNIKKENNL